MHYSSGPLNHWFYLASEGSGAKIINGVSYNSPTCNASTVTPIGRDKAAKIWYRTLTTYLTSGSTYAAAREGAIQSAKDLYGAASSECTGIAASFSAIAVPPGAATCGHPPPPSGSNLLSNPGFESGDTLWSATASVIGQWGSALPDPQPAHSGTWSAWLGGYGMTHNDSISQLVTIPAGSSATLSYYVHIDTDEAPASYDTLTVRAGSTVLQTLSNLNAADGYQLKTVDLSAYAGRTISLSFTGVEDASLSTSFVLDDTSVTASFSVRVTPCSGTRNLFPVGVVFAGSGPRSAPDGSRSPQCSPLVTSPVMAGQTSWRSVATAACTCTAATAAAGSPGRVPRSAPDGARSPQCSRPGDFTGDGRPDVLAVRSNGGLYLYRGNGRGGFAGSGAKIGAGWGTFVRLFSPGDFTGDGRSDVLAVRSNGGLYLYRGNGRGGVRRVGCQDRHRMGHVRHSVLAW